MANINLKCPHCGTMIQTASMPGLEAKNATCPKCQTSSKIGEYLPAFSLKVAGKKYQLKFGKQWVGRESESSQADIKIPDGSNYMSRQHAQIELACTAAGITCLYEENALNPTMLQGIELIKGDIVYLSPNDCLQLGDVRMYLAPEFAE